MIPKYIFDTEQQCLQGDKTIKDKILSYRKLLYKELLIELKKPFANKIYLINHYKVDTSEIDYKLTILNKRR